MNGSTFFGIVIKPNTQSQTQLKTDLMLTMAVIDPSAGPNDVSRLIMILDQNDAAILCQLDGSEVTSMGLNIQILSGVSVSFKVAGNAPIHLSGFYPPESEGNSVPYCSNNIPVTALPGFELGPAK